jgi:hypothetical protein
VARQEHLPTVTCGPQQSWVSIEKFLGDRCSSTSAGAANPFARSQRPSPTSSAPSDGVYARHQSLPPLTYGLHRRLVQHPRDDVVWPCGARSMRRRSRQGIYGPWSGPSNEVERSLEPGLIQAFVALRYDSYAAVG